MSLIFGIALPHFGLILADTRLHMKQKDGGESTNDDRPLDLLHSDGSKLISFGVNNRKFMQIKNGFAASGGHALWGNFILKSIAGSGLSEISEIQNTIFSCYQNSREKIASIIPDSEDEIDRTTLLIINSSGPEANIYALDCKGSPIPLNGNVYFYFPPDIDRSLCDKYNQVLMKRFVPPRNLNDVSHNIKLIAGIQNDISLASQYVSNIAEVGVTMKVGNTFMNKYLSFNTSADETSMGNYIIKSISNA